MTEKHPWEFRARFRAGVYDWKCSGLAIKHLKEAVAEIKKLAGEDAIVAADGAVTLFERLWPSLEHVDSSSGALGGAVGWAQVELLPILIGAPANRKTRDKWLQRLWVAIQEDGVDYLSPTEERWGEICGSLKTASKWADDTIELVRLGWAERKSGYVFNATVCLSSLLAAGRHQDLWDLLAVSKQPFWHHRLFGVHAFLKEGRHAEALAYAEASRGLNQPNGEIDAMCERILFETGRSDEAYKKYGLTASESATGLATFRAIAKKYPQIDPSQILNDLARKSGETGRWFASAKDAGFLELAIGFARDGRTDPRTLSRASRDFVTKNTEFALAAGRMAVERMLRGEGHDITSGDVQEAYRHLSAAAEKLGVIDTTRAETRAVAAEATSKADKLLAVAVIDAIEHGPRPKPLYEHYLVRRGRKTRR